MPYCFIVAHAIQPKQSTFGVCGIKRISKYYQQSNKTRKEKTMKIDKFNQDFYSRVSDIIVANGKVSEDDMDTLFVIFDFCDLHSEEAEDFVTAGLTFLQLAESDEDRLASAKKIKQALDNCGLRFQY